MRRPSILRNRGIAAAMLCASFGAATLGLAFPLISVHLERAAGSGPLIGLMAIAGAASTILVTPFMPAMFARWSPRRVLIAAAVGGAISFAAFALTQDIRIWFALRFAVGVFGTIIFVGSETWINQLAPEASRGRIMGLYATCFAGGLGVGAVLFTVAVDAGGWGFVMGGGLMAACLIALVIPAPGPRRPRADETGLSVLLATASVAPAAIAAGLAFGAIETATFNFLPVYALRIGLGAAGAGLLMTAVAVGNIALQYPIGRASDAIGRTRSLIYIAIGGVILPLVLIIIPDTLGPQMAVVFVYAGLITGMYAMGLALLGERLPRSRMAQANAAFVTAYGLGSVISPAIAGAAIDAAPPDGLLWVLSAFAAAFLVVIAVAASRRRLSPPQQLPQSPRGRTGR